MTIKEVSEKYHITQDTLRYYERVGMIPKVTRTPSGIRNYQPEDLGWVELALCMRNAGLPVEVMIEYVTYLQLHQVCHCCIIYALTAVKLRVQAYYRHHRQRHILRS